jgi:uncharacterized protein (TIGR02996 family)
LGTKASDSDSLTGRALLQAIADDPESDAPRLVYADWLDDHGDADQAEFIRVQCASARLEEEDPDRFPLLRREHELLRKNRARWTPPFSRAIDRFDFRRGLVGHATLSVVKFAAHGRAMLRKAPTLSEVTLTNLSGQGLRLRDSAHLALVTRLYLNEPFPYTWIDGLLDCPHLTRLSHLTLPLLPANVVTPEVGQRLQSWAPLHGLRSLDLVGAPLESDELQELAGSDVLANLRVLRMGYPPLVVPLGVQERGLRALMGSGHLTHLRQLEVRGARLREGAILALAHSAHTPRLSRLVLRGNGLTAGHLESLFRCDALRGAAHLGLPVNQLGDEGAKLLAGCAALAGVRFLSLASNRIGPEGVGALARSPHLRDLAGLDLSWNDLGSAGLKALLSASFLPSLRYLDLSATKLREGDLKALCACPELAHLRQLVLGWNSFLGDVDIKALASSPYVTRLLALNLIGVDAGPEALRVLYKSANVNELLVLAMASSQTEIPGAADLFLASPLPGRLLRLHIFPWPRPSDASPYAEALGDRLVISSEG